MGSIGEYIKSLRELKNYSQRKLGYLSDVSNATINRIENNISMPDPDTLKKLAHPLGVPYEKLLSAAGYLSGRKFVPSNIRLIREEKGLTYTALADDIKRVTGYEVTPGVLESVEKGEDGSDNPLLLDAIAMYKGINPEFFFRENTPRDLEYAVRNFPYNESVQSRKTLSHIKDEELKLWIYDPANTDYLVFAKKVSDLGISPEFVLNEFVLKIFKGKRNKRTKI